MWVDGQISWLDDGTWDVQFSYPHESLIGHTVARNDFLGVMLEFDDAVDCEQNVFMRSVHVINVRNHPRNIRLFMHQAFVIGDSQGNTDTAQYLPDTNAVMHYRGRRVFLASGSVEDRPFDQHSIGLFGIEGREGSWRDADDGELSGSTIEHGRVDSVLRFSLDIAEHASGRVHYWIAAGTSMRSAIAAHKRVQDAGFHERFQETANWWNNWLKPARRAAQNIPEHWRKHFVTSAMIVRSQMDNKGAIMASTDSAMLNYGRDAYAYCWPRDGAYIVWPLMRMGYTDEVMRFFDFCKRALHPKGYLSHKYRSDGALGSSWHTYVHESGVAPPIQTDETALTLFVLCQYYHHNPSEKLLTDYYESFLKPMADFIATYIDHKTQLPLPSYDLWEENYIVSTYTTAVTYAALVAAAEIAEIYHDNDSAVSWQAVAEDMHRSANEMLYSESSGKIIKGLVPHLEGYTPDETIDTAAVFGASMFGLFAANDERTERAVQATLDRFNQHDRVGLPRYENDAYRRLHDGADSNYWHITTLWYAQHLIELGKQDEASKLIEWSMRHSYASGVMAEQIRPDTEFSTSVAPLTWSHAEFMATALDFGFAERGAGAEA